jgi:hypothetical protein
LNFWRETKIRSFWEFLSAYLGNGGGVCGRGGVGSGGSIAGVAETAIGVTAIAQSQDSTLLLGLLLSGEGDGGQGGDNNLKLNCSTR